MFTLCLYLVEYEQFVQTGIQKDWWKDLRWCTGIGKQGIHLTVPYVGTVRVTFHPSSAKYFVLTARVISCTVRILWFPYTLSCDFHSHMQVFLICECKSCPQKCIGGGWGGWCCMVGRMKMMKKTGLPFITKRSPPSLILNFFLLTYLLSISGAKLRTFCRNGFLWRFNYFQIGLFLRF